MNMDLMHIPESFFHYLWKHRAYHPGLKSAGGENIQVLHTGTHNRDSGPDFLMAKVRIGQTIWAGNVEIHIKASDWYMHGHHLDKAYNNVILHVVAFHDREVRDEAGSKLQTLCMEGAFDQKLLTQYHKICRNLNWVPCSNLIPSVPGIILVQTLHSRAIERLYKKTMEIKDELAACNNDWEECCYRLTGKQFGSKINTMAFETLARTIPAKVLMKHCGDQFSLEALLFGQSGLLHRGLREQYPRQLKKEHAYLSLKYGLMPMPGYLWKFMRLRPAGFPTLRISQLAGLYARQQRVFQSMLEQDKLEKLLAYFKLEASPYWDSHYIFGRKSKKRKKRFGRQSARLLLINAIIPLMHLYGEQMHKPSLCERAISFLEGLPPEQNALVSRWKETGVEARNALETQGLIQLKTDYCDQKHCLECPIGHFLLKQE